MPRRLSDVERLEVYFLTAPVEQCVLQRDRIDLILRARGGAPVPPARGRKSKAKTAPPIGTVVDNRCRLCNGRGLARDIETGENSQCPHCKGTGKEPKEEAISSGRTDRT